MRGTLLDRYLAGDVVRYLAFGLALFTIVWLAPETLFQLVQALVAGDIGLWRFVQLLLLHLPAVFQQSFPMAAMVAGVFLVRRLSQQFELISLQASQISLLRIARPLFAVGLALAFTHAVIQEWVLPLAEPLKQQYLVDSKLESASSQNFVYLQRSEVNPRQIDWFLLVGDVTPVALRDFFVLYYRPLPPNAQGAAQGSHIHRIFRAENGAWSEENQAWQLRNGIEYELDSEGVYRAIHRFDEQLVATSPYPVELIRLQQQDPTTFSVANLARYIHLLKESQQTQDLPFYQIQLHQKIAVPLASLVLLLLGALLGQEPPRSRFTWGLTSAAVVLFVYLVSVPFATNLGSYGLVSPLVAAWLPLLVAIGVGLGIHRLRHQGRV